MSSGRSGARRVHVCYFASNHNHTAIHHLTTLSPWRAVESTRSRVAWPRRHCLPIKHARRVAQAASNWQGQEEGRGWI